ncbi:MAG: TlpA disulfide reductase family protein [Candidatus Pseudobacter hemicellulosilyticus]|uniref:TlpA disulfide reductase family protein n=1 Tax=Candidatus Pseudobacter hemicellulosilyticus TaxID=3121375 RepID=A0AAJ6BG12_9BACT|nr:MAG: TlpA disulfide reductase family protein [Pseudobacter sp.]
MQQLNGILLAAALLLSGALQAQQPFTLKGKLTDPELEGQRLNLRYFNGTKSVNDSCFLKNGLYEFTGTLVTPVSANLTIVLKTKPHPRTWPVPHWLDLYLDSGVISLEGSTLAGSVVKGGRSQQEFAALRKLRVPLQDSQRLTGFHIDNAPDTLEKQRYRDLYRQLGKMADSVSLAFVRTNPTSYVSLDIVRSLVNPKNLANEREAVEKLYSGLSDELQQTKTGKDIAGRLANAGKLSVGKKAIDFTMNDTLGRPVSLSSFKGKYVLLDFWASWCHPCRLENPHVVKAYAQYKDRNFTVLSVSLDQPGKHQAWVDAIHKDGLNWTHVSDLKYWNNAAVKLYGVNSVPMNYLINPEGVIVGVYLRGEELLKKLEELL